MGCLVRMLRYSTLPAGLLTCQVFRCSVPGSMDEAVEMSRSGTFLLCPPAVRVTWRDPTLTVLTKAICLPRRSRRRARASSVLPLISSTSAISSSLGKSLVFVFTFMTAKRPCAKRARAQATDPNHESAMRTRPDEKKVLLLCHGVLAFVNFEPDEDAAECAAEGMEFKANGCGLAQDDHEAGHADTHPTHH
eukprot:2882085-Prymnesium_polylepis.1